MHITRSARFILGATLLTGALSAVAIAGQDFRPVTTPNILGADATPDILISPENAVQPTRVIDGATGAELGAGFPFGPFGGGNRIAAGDLNDDGVADIVAGMGPGGGSVQLFDGATVASLGGGLPFGPFGGGVFLAVGDLDGDGRNDIGVSQGSAGGLVRVFSGIDYSLLLSLAPFGPGYAGGVSLAMGDLDGDARADLIAGQLAGGQVAIIDGATRGTIVAGPPFGGHTGGIHVAAGDVNGDGRGDIILAPATGGGSIVVYDLQTVSQIGSFFPYGNAFTGGVRLAAADLNGDGRADIVTGPGPGGGAEVRVFSGDGFGQILAVPGYGAGYTGGTFVAAPTTSAIRFTTAPATTFTAGQSGTFTVRTAGTPRASTLGSAGALPTGVTFTDHGNGTATLAGTPTTPGSFPLTFTATGGGRPPVTQAFTLTVQQAPAITSANAFTFNVGAAGTFTVTSIGFPTPTISLTGALPAGLTFTANGDGTATVTGTPATGTPGSYSLTFTAANGVGTPAAQGFTLVVVDLPPDALNDTYVNGVGNTQYVVGAGTPATPAVVVTGTVLDNDFGAGPLTVGPPVIATTNGGQVVMSGTGSFVYTPAGGFAGPADTFTYTLTDALNRTDTAVVTINLSGVVWYVNGAAVAGDGRSHAPFNTVAAAAAAASAGQAIYVHQGTYPGNVTLAANQTLWGAGALFTMHGLTIPATAGPVLDGTLTLADGDLATGFTVDRVAINGGAGTIGVGAVIANTTGHSVQVQNRTGGTVTFSGAITDTGTGILLSNNAGAAIAFTGGIALSTGANAAFTATGGGIVTATQNNTSVVNTLATTTGTALHVSGTQIGSAGLAFRSISAGIDTFSPGVGILLNDTGVAAGNGGLTVTGTGTDQSGGIIRRKSGPNGATTQGVGISLTNTRSPSFRWMHLTDFENSAVVLRDVAVSFQFADSRIVHAGNAAGEGGITFGLPSPSAVNGLQTGGAATIRNAHLQENFDHGVAFYSQSGSTALQMDGTTPAPDDCFLGRIDTSEPGAYGLYVLLEGAGTTSTVTVDGCLFRDNAVAGVVARAIDSSALTFTVNESEWSRGGDGLVLENSDDAELTGTVTNNSIAGVGGAGIRLGQAPFNATDLSMLRATVTGNSFATPAAAPVSSIVARFSSTVGQTSQARVLIANNGAGFGGSPVEFKQDGPQPGLLVTTPDAGTAPEVHLTLQLNHVDVLDAANSCEDPLPCVPGTRSPFGIDVQATQGSVCANIAANLSHWYSTSVGVGGGIRALQSGTAAFALERGLELETTPPATVLQVNNATHPVGTSQTTVSGTITVVDNNMCALPSTP